MRNVTRVKFNTFVLHAVSSHFVNGLVPVAVIFMLLTLVTANAYFEHTVFHLFCVASMAAPIALFSGIRDWRAMFHGGRAPIFYRKIKLSIVLTILCAAIMAIRLEWHDPIAAGGGIAWLYVGFILLTLPVVVLLGYLGGRLACMARQKMNDEQSDEQRESGRGGQSSR